MPLIFIHGVNTRNTDTGYEKGVRTRSDLLRKLVLDELAQKDTRFKDMQIEFPYWGNHGVRFHWHNQSLPDVETLEALGATGNDDTVASDVALVRTVAGLAGLPSTNADLEAMGASRSVYKEAANKNLTQFLEAVIMPVILSEFTLDASGVASQQDLGQAEACLALAVRAVGRDPTAAAAVNVASTDDEVLAVLQEQVIEQYEQLARPPQASPGLEPLGGNLATEAKKRIGELFDRAKAAPARALAVPLLDRYRGGLQDNLGPFFGDVFVYLQRRGNKESPGPIINEVLSALRKARQDHPGEPLIAVTHSMGGNILYDIITHFDTNLSLDVWITVGTQVGQFEEMKLFNASKGSVGEPDKVTGLKPRVGYWLNVYDPADIFGYKTEPVFADVDADVAYLTGSAPPKSHSAYFGRASFYDLLRKHIEMWLAGSQS